jgi:ribosomal protein S18 acetylase RimI-like enzyme
LRESPAAFLSQYDDEVDFTEADWKDEAARGIWLVWLSDGRPVALIGATPEPDVSPRDRYLSHLWVAPHARRTGIATRLVTDMLRRLEAAHVGRAWLWVLDGNDAARSLYLRLGFSPAGDRQPLSYDSSRFEERLTREIH